MRGRGLAPGWAAELVTILVDVGVGFHAGGRLETQAPEVHAWRIVGVATAKFDNWRVVRRESLVPIV